MSNRLINETSPYLRLHSENPVDWYPWGFEATNKAKTENKPILLSVGYAACHWCHVMERESFQNEEIAALMNNNFINVKVDREERPDIDQIYMRAVQSFTGQGGWPMTVFLTPELKPFYGGTYFPPSDLGNMPGFPRVLMAVANAYKTRYDDMVEIAESVSARLNEGIQAPGIIGGLNGDQLVRAFNSMLGEFDQINGGFNGGPKFPQPMTYEYLIRYMYTRRDKRALEMVQLTLDSMADRGMYDHLGGGFHRYSIDQKWEVPHFEKMLYDNALLARLYIHGYLLTGIPRYRVVAEETLDYVLRELRHPEGGFFTAEDADSEDSEGQFYFWTRHEIEGALDPIESQIFCRYFGIEESGEVDGTNILRISESIDSIAESCAMRRETVIEILSLAKDRLRVVRESRVRPNRDDKILTSWNGLMLAALAEGAMLLGREDYLQFGLENADFILSRLRKNGRILRTFRDGESKLHGYLEDYSFLADGLITLYEASFHHRWLEEAVSVIEDMIRLFWDEDQGVLFDTGWDHEHLITRPSNLFDNAIPSGSSAAVLALLRLGVLTGETRYVQLAEKMLETMSGLMGRYPLAFSHWLCALDFYLAKPREIAVIGHRDSPETRTFLKIIRQFYLPNTTLAGSEEQFESQKLRMPLLEGRGMIDGKPTAYVCRNYICSTPVTDPDDLVTMLGNDSRS